LTTAPGGHEIIPASAAFHHLRPCTLSSESINARGRVLNTSRTFTVAEVLVEDALGRALAHVTFSAVVRPMQPPPPTPPPELHPIAAPTYSTPDPYRRPVAPDRFPAPKQVEEAGGWQVM